jgi:hypothetical protein
VPVSERIRWQPARCSVQRYKKKNSQSAFF